LLKTRVVGGVLITVGALVFSFFSIAPSIEDSISASEQIVFADSVSISHQAAHSHVLGMPVAKIFARLYVPRFGQGYVHAIAEGTSLSKVLNKVGIGHYQSTQLPGEVGNFAIAGHRAGNGGPFRLIDTFKKGDLAYVETSAGWFTYRYLQTVIVKPKAIGVIYPRPEGLTVPTLATSFLTLTSCTPIHVNSDRIVAWFELSAQQSLTNGPPSGIKIPTK
jgi:sortase A